MSRNVELPDDVYSRIEAEASTTGSTVAQWIEGVVPPSADAPHHARAMSAVDGPGYGPCGLPDSPTIAAGEDALPEGARTMAERLAGLIGTVDSGGLDAIAARPGDEFSDYLVEKKRNGRL
ncbi:MAG TPA: hypothetical protein VEX86_15785 [Longimicrobium sp.]|nr:hypothetical protein [Longimicrobium sp.]